MYLKRIMIEHSGPIKSLNLNLAFDDAGLPKPLILVGPNGGGKTNLLSLVTDALFEAASAHHDNVLPLQGLGRAWFRFVGDRNVTVGASGGFSLLSFQDEERTVLYKEKAGKLQNDEVELRLSEDFKGSATWPEEGNFKEFTIEDERSRIIFSTGVYVCFPASRSETPHWLNVDSQTAAQFETAPNISKRLKKPIYVEKALEKFQQWLMSAMADARAEIGMVDGGGIVATGNIATSLASLTAIDVANSLLRAIIGDENAQFQWLGRKYPEKVGVLTSGKLAFHSLNALSAGQSILLGIFGTLLRYGDSSANGYNIDIKNMEGICVIDEIDAHIHIDLQSRVLPRLIGMFPRMQFILTNHSPLFVLGMEGELGAEGIQVIEMPNGLPVCAESYAEFGKALEVMAETRAFSARVVAESEAVGRPVVYVEGETDAPYLKRAAELRGRAKILQLCDIEWIGAKDTGGQGFSTGKDAFRHALSILKANPGISKRNILLLHDNDSTTPDQDYDRIYVRKIPINTRNKKRKTGIENLLTEGCIYEEFYEKKEKIKESGDSVVTVTLNKSALCHHVCETASADSFVGFDGALQIIEDFLRAVGVDLS